MDIGGKILRLRKSMNMSQPELAAQLGISQATLCNIESGNYKKIDFLLMDKVCRIFDKDFSYFANDSVINNNVKENTGPVGCENVTVNNHFPDSILTDIQNLIDENKMMKAKIAALEGKT